MNVTHLCICPVPAAILQAAAVGVGAWWINDDYTVKVAWSFHMSIAVACLYLITTIVVAISALRSSSRVTTDAPSGVQLAQMQPHVPIAMPIASAAPQASSPTGKELPPDHLDHMHVATANSPPPYKVDV